MEATLTEKNTIVITCKHLAKLGALLFGKVWVPPESMQNLSSVMDEDTYGDDQPPSELTICSQEDAEIYSYYAPKNIYKDIDQVNPLAMLMGEAGFVEKPGTQIAKEIIGKNYQKKGFNVVYLEHSRDYFWDTEDPDQLAENIDIINGKYTQGTNLIIQSAAKKITTVNSVKTSWDNIEEFKNDENMLRQYRNMRLWLASGLSVSTEEEAVDILESKLENYEWALKKHGFETTIGAIEQFLDPKTLISAATGAGVAQYLDGPIMAAIAGGVILSSKASLYAIKRSISIKSIKYFNESNDIGLLYSAMQDFDGK